ncbi:MAG: hypothetical protein JEZ09_13305 [Salinivirgaceae bacterium]|nr:hypothetical protein [Salinivirgaceae bacterium]
MNSEILITAIAFALFIVCPRMAGMLHVICENSKMSLFKTAFLGSLIAIPLILLMVWVFAQFGVVGALIFCVGTDLLAAYLLKNISYKVGFETIIIAGFVFIAVKVAPLISGVLIT